MSVVDFTKTHPFEKKSTETEIETSNSISKHSIEAHVARLMKKNSELNYEMILKRCQDHFKVVLPENVHSAVQTLLSIHIIKLKEDQSNMYIYA